MWDIEWENLFLFSLNIFKEAECLVCNQVLKNMFASHLKRHYNRMHTEFHSVSGNERNQLIKKLKEDFRLKNLCIQNRCSNNSTNTDSQIKASYIISLELAKKCRPFEDGTFFKDLCFSVMNLFGEKGKEVGHIIAQIPLSPATITRRTEDIGLFIEWETKERFKNAKYFSVCFDESVDISDISQMIICVRMVDNYFNSYEQILNVESFYGNVNGEAIYNAFIKNVLSLTQKEKLSAICTDGAAVMVGKKQGFVGQLLKAGIHVRTFHCIIHQQALFSKSIGLKETMAIAVRIINRLRGGHNALTHRKLIAFLKEIDADYGDVLMYTEVRWLSRGKCLERLFNLRMELELFFQSQDHSKFGDILNTLKCPNFLYGLAYLADITQHINSLNLILQGKDKNITELLHAVNEFSRKLIILRNQIECENLTNFPKTQEIFKQFPNVEKLQMIKEEIDSLLENFHARFKDFLSLQWIIDIFNNPLTCSLETLHDNIKEELTLMRQDLFISTEMGVKFWKNVCPNKYPVVRDLMLNIFSMFGTTYICESAFSSMSQIKNKFRNRLTDKHMDTLLKIKCYQNEIDIDKLMHFIKYKETDLIPPQVS